MSPRTPHAAQAEVHRPDEPRVSISGADEDLEPATAPGMRRGLPATRWRGIHDTGDRVTMRFRTVTWIEMVPALHNPNHATTVPGEAFRLSPRFAKSRRFG